MKKQTKLNRVASIGYRGEVIATLSSKKRKIKTVKCHNAGTSLLFARIASILAGNATQESMQMPKYIDVGTKDDTGAFQSYLVDRVFITDGGVVNREDAETYSVTFGGIIQLTNIISQYQAEPIQELRLCAGGNKEINDFLAETTLNEEITLSSQASNLIISWKMYITNANTSVDTSGGN